MRVDGAGGGGGGGVVERKKGSWASSPAAGKKVRRRQKAEAGRRAPPPQPAPAMQRLFNVCKEVFPAGRAGVVPPPEDVERIRSVLDSIKLTDVNLTKNMPYFRGMRVANGVAPVTYLPVHEGNKFSIAIFCLPPSSIIPLHNHPGMTVFSKILFGTMRIKSYDWVNNHQKAVEDKKATDVSQSPGLRLAKVDRDAIITAPCGTSILYPSSGGNMHQFTAVTACAVLDVLGPPYCDPEGRHCQYYIDLPYSKFSGEVNNKKAVLGDNTYAWLEEREKPEDFIVLGGKYTGPKIEIGDAL